MRHGVGIVDHIEDRIVGLKVRDIYEVPAAAILLKAHRELERLVGTIHQNQFKPPLDQKWAYLVYAGLWWEPLRTDIEAYIRHVNERVTGTIGLKLYKGSVRVVTRESPNAVYDAQLATFAESGGLFSQQASPGVHRDLVAAVPDGTQAAERVEPSAMFYKLLGMLVWNGGKVILRQQLRPHLPPQAASLAGAARRGRWRRRAAALARQRLGSEAERPRSRRVLTQAAAASGTMGGAWPSPRPPHPCAPRPRRRDGRVAALGRRERARARARPVDRRGGPRAGPAGAGAAGRRGRAPVRLAARRALLARPGSWRGTYLVPAELVATDPEALWLEWAERRAVGPAGAGARRRAAAGARGARAARASPRSPAAR